MAAAHVLPAGVGLPARKVAGVWAVSTRVRLTQGALKQDALRRSAGTVGIADEEWRTAVPEAPVVHTDDIGWRVGGKPAHLMAFEAQSSTVHQIQPQLRHREVQEVIPADYAGVMVAD